MKKQLPVIGSKFVGPNSHTAHPALALEGPQVTPKKPMTVPEAANRIRSWARTNFTPKDMSYHQFIALANELDPEGERSGTADTVYSKPKNNGQKEV